MGAAWSGALTELRLQFDGVCGDIEMLASLDRIDSDGHYKPRDPREIPCELWRIGHSTRVGPMLRSLLHDNIASRNSAVIEKALLRLGLPNGTADARQNPKVRGGCRHLLQWHFRR